jgi:quercetin dioxygenase-like cupin family protein
MTAHSAPFHISTSDEPLTYFLGIPTVVRATSESTNGAFGLVDHLTVHPGFASPYHTHRLEDEAFYVIEGSVAFMCDGKWVMGGPGSYVFGPRHIPHGFTVVGQMPAHLLLLNAPGGFEQFIAELSGPRPAPPDLAELSRVAAKYQIDIHGPLPDVPRELRGRDE